MGKTSLNISILIATILLPWGIEAQISLLNTHFGFGAGAELIANRPVIALPIGSLDVGTVFRWKQRYWWLHTQYLLGYQERRYIALTFTQGTFSYHRWFSSGIFIGHRLRFSLHPPYALRTSLAFNTQFYIKPLRFLGLGLLNLLTISSRSSFLLLLIQLQVSFW